MSLLSLCLVSYVAVRSLTLAVLPIRGFSANGGQTNNAVIINATSEVNCQASVCTLFLICLSYKTRSPQSIEPWNSTCSTNFRLYDHRICIDLTYAKHVHHRGVEPESFRDGPTGNCVTVCHGIASIRGRWNYGLNMCVIDSASLHR